MKVVKAAAVQFSPVLYSREATVAKVVKKIHELGKKGVQFATFPETVVPYYPYFASVQTGIELLSGTEHLRLLEQAVTVPSAATDAIGEAARKAGKASGILAPVKADADRYLADGFTMVAVGSDLGLLARGSDALIASFNR